MRRRQVQFARRPRPRHPTPATLALKRQLFAQPTRAVARSADHVWGSSGGCLIAAGGGRISSVLQAQTAWLYLKHTRKIERALSETFADAREP